MALSFRAPSARYRPGDQISSRVKYAVLGPARAIQRALRRAPLTRRDAVGDARVSRLRPEEMDDAATIIAGMARAVEAKDPATRGHADRVTTYAIALAQAAGLSPQVQEAVAGAGPLHDIGKIGVPDMVLRKPGRLSEEDLAIIRHHPEIGDEICMPLRSLRQLRAGIRWHHERYDGRGYPDGLLGEQIPLEARVLAIADAFDAMTSDRPYRRAMPLEKALAILSANEGPQWDPALIPVFCATARSLSPS